MPVTPDDQNETSKAADRVIGHLRDLLKMYKSDREELDRRMGDVEADIFRLENESRRARNSKAAAPTG